MGRTRRRAFAAFSLALWLSLLLDARAQSGPANSAGPVVGSTGSQTCRPVSAYRPDVIRLFTMPPMLRPD